jgi:uncharacterized protein YndB with AHSA1/START domain
VNVTEQVSAVRRTVGTRVLEAGEAKVVTVARTYPTSVEDLWGACTTADRVARWFMPVSGELKAGGHYQLEGNAGGTVERCDPPRSFAATWEYGGEVSWIEVRFTPEGPARTRFELEHVAHVDDERWAQFGPGAVGVGWDLGLLGLGLYLESQAARDEAAEPAWLGSPEGRAFVSGTSAAWGEASRAAGTPAGEATAAAERTTEFYTPAG